MRALPADGIRRSSACLGVTGSSSSFRNPYSAPEQDSDATKPAEAPEAQKGRKGKNKEKGRVEKDKPVLVDVDLNLSAYANAKK